MSSNASSTIASILALIAYIGVSFSLTTFIVLFYFHCPLVVYSLLVKHFSIICFSSCGFSPAFVSVEGCALFFQVRLLFFFYIEFEFGLKLCFSIFLSMYCRFVYFLACCGFAFFLKRLLVPLRFRPWVCLGSCITCPTSILHESV